ncbi:MAG: hypothetical protein K0R29_1498 [Pseudobdellovibrio sp.]|jgi:hypothetical protein|nr:hypothetical protein [Pseudobdellovibrio sp.]
MKTILLTLLITVSTQSALAATLSAPQSNDPSSVVATVEVTDVTAQYPEFRVQETHFENLAQAGATLTAVDVIVDKVINIGTKVWNVLEKGRATYNYQNQQANALPQGARRWNQLQNWRQPTSKVYSVTGKNVFGYEILRFDYRVILLAGGDVGGVGRYIGYATVHPMEVNIPYLTNFDVGVRVDSVYNTGTARNPVAGMVMNISIRATSVVPLMPIRELGHSLVLDGNGNIRTM